MRRRRFSTLFDPVMNETYDDRDILGILQSTRSIAVVGASTNPNRHSHRVMAYMQRAGYRVLPVNPGAVGQTILGETVYASLADVPGPFELVDVFRRLDAIPGVLQEVIAARQSKGIRCLWLQLDLYNEEVARQAREAGLTVVMDRCLKVEYGRLIAHSG